MHPYPRYRILYLSTEKVRPRPADHRSTAVDCGINRDAAWAPKGQQQQGQEEERWLGQCGAQAGQQGRQNRAVRGGAGRAAEARRRGGGTRRAKPTGARAHLGAGAGGRPARHHFDAVSPKLRWIAATRVAGGSGDNREAGWLEPGHLLARNSCSCGGRRCAAARARGRKAKQDSARHGGGRSFDGWIGGRVWANLVSEVAGTKISHRDVGNAAKRWEISKRKRPLVETGSRNKTSDWAKARQAICLQFRSDLQQKKKFLDGTLFADEHTERCVLAERGHHGQGARIQYSVPKKDGVYCPPSEGGKYSPLRSITKPKFDATASGCFAVAAPTVDGVRVGRKATPVRYTGTVVGVGRYERELQKMFVTTRALGQKSRDQEAAGAVDKRGRKKRNSVWHDHTMAANPYESRFGPDWQQKLPSTFKFFSIATIMDHLKAEGDRIFAGTPREADWLIYHDRLPQWWEPDAQAHMERLGMAHRQWWAEGATNESLTEYYKEKLFGDSPEMMPLDSSLFNDLIEAIGKNVCATVGLDAKERHSMSTPDEAWQTMCAVWQTADAVSSGRIIQDIDRVLVAIERIIEADGAYVEELDYRNGHRKAAQLISRGGALTAQAQAGLDAQMETWNGLSGGCKN
eukprot:SAG11_NODE_2500_length_3282_cov_3.538800_1_plen_631_part_00